MAAKRKRAFIGLLVIFYLIAALLPLLAFCSAREEPEEAAPETSQQSPAGSAVEQTGIFRIEDADGEILEVEDSEFVKGGIAAEVPPSWEPEALKAQGVALYTYYSRLREQTGKKGAMGRISPVTRRRPWSICPRRPGRNAGGRTMKPGKRPWQKRKRTSGARPCSRTGPCCAPLTSPFPRATPTRPRTYGAGSTAICSQRPARGTCLQRGTFPKSP